eukprot:8307681-Pyramimonas_sp.AAC.1
MFQTCMASSLCHSPPRVSAAWFSHAVERPRGFDHRNLRKETIKLIRCRILAFAATIGSLCNTQGLKDASLAWRRLKDGEGQGWCLSHQRFGPLTPAAPKRSRVQADRTDAIHRRHRGLESIFQGLEPIAGD